MRAAVFLLDLVPLLLVILIITMLQLICPSVSTLVSVQELLRKSGLPGGLFPKAVKSYSVSEGGLLEVVLEGPCLTKFDTTSLYQTVIRANLTYGGLTGLQGLSQEELFLWVPVKHIILDNPRSGLILFDIGLAHKQLSLSLFEDPPRCHNQHQLPAAAAAAAPPPVAGNSNKWRKDKGFAEER